MAEPIIIAHRGASGYLPEHTLAAKAMAHAMGAHFLEQDVVLTKDSVPIILHDIHLEPTTDVALKFPNRARADGHYYAGDFSLEEISQLYVHERTTGHRSGNEQAVYPQRFPTQLQLFRVPTLAQEIDLISGLNQSTGRCTGLYIELKSPRWHQAQGLNIVDAIMQVLVSKNYHDKPEQVYLQCFDDLTLQHLRRVVKTPLPLVQLIADNSWGEDSAVDYDYLQTDDGLRYVKSYADGIGPWLQQLYLGKSARGDYQCSDLTQRAQALSLKVHPYTLRRDDLPADIADFDELLDLVVNHLAVEGLFTDFPDLARQFLDRAPVIA